MAPGAADNWDCLQCAFCPNGSPSLFCFGKARTGVQLQNGIANSSHITALRFIPQQLRLGFPQTGTIRYNLRHHPTPLLRIPGAVQGLQLAVVGEEGDRSGPMRKCNPPWSDFRRDFNPIARFGQFRGVLGPMRFSVDEVCLPSNVQPECHNDVLARFVTHVHCFRTIQGMDVWMHLLCKCISIEKKRKAG